MNPYDTPKAEVIGGGSEVGVRKGRRCPACGSSNTLKDDVLRVRPSILMVMLFGWFFLLVRGAFSKRTEQCGDCGAIFRYKTTGSLIALAVLICLAICVAMALMVDSDPP